MSHPPPAFSYRSTSSGPAPPPHRPHILTAVTLSPATSSTDGPGFDTLTNEGVGVFVPLWAIARALEGEEGMGRGEEGGGADNAPIPPQRTQPSLPAQPALFPSLPLLSSSASSSVHSSTLPTRLMGTPFEGAGHPRARTSFAFPSSTTTTTLPPAYFPPPPLPPASHPSLSYAPSRSPAFDSEASDSESDISNHASSNPYAALAGPALKKARADFLARDWAYRSQAQDGYASSEAGEAEGGREKGGRGRESDAEWVPGSEEAKQEAGRERDRRKGKRRVAATDVGGGGAVGGGVVTEPATEPLSLRWIPSLHAFLPSEAPYRSLSPTRPSSILTFPPSSYVRVFTSSSRAPEAEVFPYSASSAKRNTFLRALLAHRFPSLSCACGFSFLRPSSSASASTTAGAGEGGGWKKPSVLRDHLARCVALGEEDEVRRLCALERGLQSWCVEKVAQGREKE